MMLSAEGCKTLGKKRGSTSPLQCCKLQQLVDSEGITRTLKAAIHQEILKKTALICNLERILAYFLPNRFSTVKKGLWKILWKSHCPATGEPSKGSIAF